MHARRREVAVPMFDLGLDDTAHPYLLFLSQAETERILAEQLGTLGVTVERGVELVDLAGTGDGARATLRHRGTDEVVHARYVVGCDGAHSTVRRLAGIRFEGGSYPQTFVLADTEADGLAPGAAHVYLAAAGMLFFFPLGSPATWRLLAMRPPGAPTTSSPAGLPEVQALADAYTGGAVRLHDPVWSTDFRVHHRAAVRYRAGSVLLAGDAAHVHSPAGAQGMNTGIQDAHNLAWKLAHTVRGVAGPALLDTYETELAPIGARVLRFTDRAFTVATSTGPMVRFARSRLAPMLVPLVLGSATGRAYAFRTISQLGVRYPDSPLSTDGPHPPRGGPAAGDRLPDASVVHNGQIGTLHGLLARPGWHLLLCGLDTRPAPGVADVGRRHADMLTVHRLPADAALRLGSDRSGVTQYLVRPDGHVGYRAGGADGAGLGAYLTRWTAGALGGP
jgi:2-polyprenyl-6-methoxyphenol hydroxylase-like FAD-dependent oxidoreductase